MLQHYFIFHHNIFCYRNKENKLNKSVKGHFIQQHLPSDTFDLSWISIFGNDRVRVHCIYSDDVSFKQNKSKTKYKTKQNKNK
jgi:hypothetical protein